VVTPVPSPLTLHEDVAARRWVAARALRVPIMMLKIGTPVLIMANLAVIVRHPNLAAAPIPVLLLLAVSFFLPFAVAIAYPLLRRMPQEWRLDAEGVHGRGRVRGDFAWPEITDWKAAPPAHLITHVAVEFRRGRSWVRMIVPAGEQAAVEAWFRGAAPPSVPS
jgi:hypothetical protein